MKSFLIACLLLSATVVFAQPHSTVYTAEDSLILMKIQIVDGLPRYFELNRAPFELSENLREDNCSYYRGDSLFTGVIKTTSGDSAYRLERCVNGKLNGEQLRMKHIPWHANYFVPDYYSWPIEDNSVILRFEQYHDEFYLAKTGCTILENDCKGFENFFGSNDPGNCEYREFYPGGQLKSSYKTGIRGYDGYKETFYPNGQLKERTVFSNGTPTGKWVRYSESGELLEKLVFRNGKANGTWESKRIRHRRLD